MDDLRAVIEAAGFERPAVLGISEGGPMSTLYAATYPTEISALVLFGAYARMLEAPGFPAGISEARSIAGGRWCAKSGAGRLPCEAGRRAGSATPSSNAGGRGCCARGRAPQGRSR